MIVVKLCLINDTVPLNRSDGYPKIYETNQE